MYIANLYFGYQHLLQSRAFNILKQTVRQLT